MKERVDEISSQAAFKIIYNRMRLTCFNENIIRQALNLCSQMLVGKINR